MVQIPHVLCHRAVLVAGVQPVDLVRRVLLGRRDVLHDHVDEGADPTAGTEELQEDLLQQGPRVQVAVALVKVDSDLRKRGGEVVLLLAQAVGEDLVDGLQHELHKGPRLVSVRRILLEAASVLVEVEVAPQALCEHLVVEVPAVSLGVESGVRLEREHHPEEARGEEHVALERREVSPAVHLGADCVVEPLEGLVDVLDAVAQLVVGVCRRQLQLDDQAVHAVDHEDKVQLLLQGVLHHALDVHTQA
mmetsp:Transcript_111213/g.295560  ORF Transcript_111213/g.295560 Transcript_111213/m.295560 type:complete len:248 (+) Transcript_111213:1694-2437(+)